MDSIPPGRFLSREPHSSTSGSQTSTIAGPSSALATSSDADGAQPATILRLRGTGTRDSRNVQWAEGVVDNEGLNRKKSKVCCIYHRPRAVDESSDESSSSDSDSSSSSDEDSDGGLAARSDADQAFRGRPGANRRRPAQHQHTPGCPEHQHGGHDDSNDDEGHENGDRQRGGKGKGKGKGKARRRPSPNAYEKIPRNGRPPAPGV